MKIKQLSLSEALQSALNGYKVTFRHDDNSIATYECTNQGLTDVFGNRSPAVAFARRQGWNIVGKQTI